MSISIRTDLNSKLVIFGLNNNLSVMYDAIQRLATGKKINSAADSPAGLMISKQLLTQIASLNQEIDNISANISKYATVSASVGELRSQLTELRSLAVGAANEGFNSQEAQDAYNIAAGAIISSYNLTAASAYYNGAPTLDGSPRSLASVTELADIDLSTADGAVAALERIDAAAAELDQISVDLGATQKNDLEARRQSLEVTRQNLSSAESIITDADYAAEASLFTASLIRSQMSLALLGHSLSMRNSLVSLLTL
jgi:flagellin